MTVKFNRNVRAGVHAYNSEVPTKIQVQYTQDIKSTIFTILPLNL